MEQKTITCQQLWPDKPYFAVSFLGKPYGFLFGRPILWYPWESKVVPIFTFDQSIQVAKLDSFAVRLDERYCRDVVVNFCEKNIPGLSYLLFDSFNLRSQEPKHIVPKNGSHSYQALMIKLSEFFDYQKGVLQEDILFEFKQVV